MKEKISQVFQNIQHLNIQPTEGNVMLIADCLMKLKEVYAMLPDEQPQMEPVPEEAPEEDATEKEDEDG